MDYVPYNVCILKIDWVNYETCVQLNQVGRRTLIVRQIIEQFFKYILSKWEICCTFTHQRKIGIFLHIFFVVFNLKKTPTTLQRK